MLKETVFTCTNMFPKKKKNAGNIKIKRLGQATTHEITKLKERQQNCKLPLLINLG